MQIDLGNIIVGGIAVLGALVTCIQYAASAHNKADRALERNDDLSSQLAELRAKHEALDSKIVDKLSKIEQALARIQGRLDIKTDSIES